MGQPTTVLDDSPHVGDPQSRIGDDFVEPVDDVRLAEHGQLGQRRSIQAPMVLGVPGRTGPGVAAQPSEAGVAALVTRFLVGPVEPPTLVTELREDPRLDQSGAHRRRRITHGGGPGS